MHYVEKVWGGLVLSEREENRYHDSYFHITVWNPASNAAEEICYASTAGGNADDSGPLQHDTVKRIVAMTPEHVWEAYQRWKQTRYAAAQIEVLSLSHELCNDIGATVRVARGRKVPKGTIGRIMSVRRETVHVSRYGTWAQHRNLAMLDTGEGFPLIDLANCDLVQPSKERAQLLFDLAH